MRCAAVAGVGLLLWLPPSGGTAPHFRPFDELRAVPSGVEGRLKPEATQPQTDRPQTKNAARLSGRVVAAGTGKPVRRAIVLVSPPNVAHLGTSPPGGRRAITNDDGIWEITGLPPGRYVISVTKTGYVRTQYGQRRALEPAKVVELAAGAAIDRLDVRLPNAAAIAGRIGDELGDPITPALVTIQQMRYLDGEPVLKPVAEGILAVYIGGLTDDRGEYRVHGLGPGTYFVSATADTVASGPPGETSQLAPTYYPGTPNVSEAQPVTVRAGEELLNISFNLVRTRVAKISGLVLGSTGEPISAGLELKNTSPLPIALQAMAGADGRFTLADVPPGSYRLEVESRRWAALPELTSMPLTVTGDDVSDLVITTRRGATAAGRIVTDDGSAVPAGVEVFAVAASRDAFTPGWSAGRAPARGETFEIRGLLDLQLIRARPPPGWFLKAVTLGRQSIIDSGYAFRAGVDVPDIEVTIGRRAAGVRGTVTDGDAPTADYTVVAFSIDDRKWGPQTRYVHLARPTQHQEFTIDGLPPDDYFVIALDYLEPGEETDRTRLDAWKADATRVTVTDDRPAVVTLKLKR